MKRFLFIALLCLISSASFAEQRMGYSVNEVNVQLSEGNALGFLLVPDFDRKPSNGFPAIVALHDHGAWFTIGKEKLVRPIDTSLLEESNRWVNKFYDGAYLADTLASRGYVVLVIDALYWGTRSIPHPGFHNLDSLKLINKQLKSEQPQFALQHEEQYHVAWFESILQDDKFCVDFLTHLPYVNVNRIGVCGFSMGAYRAWQLAADDSRVSACVSANWFTTRKAYGVESNDSISLLPNESAYSMYRPSLRNTEYAAIASHISPRPFLLLYGTEDPLFPVPAVREAISLLPPSGLQVVAIDAPHRFTSIHLTETLRFFNENL